jgi:class 3 adenylate cyclase
MALCHFGQSLQGHAPRALPIIRKQYKQIKKLAGQCIDDFAHKALFTRAMMQAIQGNTGAALQGFQQALDAINPDINRFDKAICAYIYALYCQKTGFNELAVLKLKQSRNLFEWIQATAVVDYQNQLLDAWNDNSSRTGAVKDNAVSVSNSVTHDGIDLFSVIKSTHVISSEYELSELLKRMLPLIVENAGAQKGVLVLIDDQHLYVKASSNDRGEVVVYDDLPVAQFDISQPILNFTSNTGEAVILEHAHLTGRFVNDPYIVKNKVRSLLCMAISHKNKLTGLLYLENNLTSGAFNQNRTQVLNILATQASISIENATYFRHINQLNVAYERFVPKSFLSYLNKDSILNIRVGDQVKKEMAVMFADIRNFTGISENMSSEQVFDLLNEVWGLLNPVIDKHGGIIDKYIGDSIMALFPDDKASAVLAAVEMQKLMHDFNALRKQQALFPLRMGIGINAGVLNLGTLGSDTRLNTTVIGDTVNVASRLEGLSKQLDAQVIFTLNTLEQQARTATLSYRNLGKLPLKGKERGVSILEEYSTHPEAHRRSIEAHLPLFEQIVAAFEAEDHSNCRRLITAYQLQFPEDAAVNFIETCIPAQAAGL